MNNKHDKINKALELQQQGIIYKKMTDEQCEQLIGYKRKKALHKAMLDSGYKYNSKLGIFEIDAAGSILDTVTDSTIDANTETITEGITDTATTVEVVENTKDYNNSITDTVTTETDITVQGNFIDYLQQTDIQSKLFELLQYADKLIQSVKGEQIGKSIVLTIDTREKAIQKNLRMYESVAEDFKAFCNRHKEYKQQELVSQALREFMNKYN